LAARSKKQSAEDKTSYQNKYSYSGKIICAEHNMPYYRSLYRYKSGDKEVWQCREYASKGKAGCASPIVYTSEIDEVLKDAYNVIATEKSSIIHDLIKVYSSIGSASAIQGDIAKIKAEINLILAKKDKLLDLSIDGRLTNDEFEARNKAFNSEIDKLQIKIADLQEQEKKNRETICGAETLGKMIAGELNFDDGFDNAIVDSLLDRIEVYRLEDKKTIGLNVYFKVLNEDMKYKITRGKTTSVCYVPYI